MKNLFLLFTCCCLVLTSCSKEEPIDDPIEQTDNDPNDNVDPDPDPDPIVIPKEIFAGGKEYTYRAKYKNADGQLLSDEYILISTTGEPWIYDPSQQGILIQYDYSDETEDDFTPHPLNPDIQFGFHEVDNTGIIENASELWMHPIRSNQYIFNELAPFPNIRFPLEEGNTWGSSLSIISGWGIWNNTSVANQYEIEDMISKAYDFGDLDSIWVVEATGTSSFGISNLELYYHEIYGFVEMNYENYIGETLKIKLEEASYEGQIF